METRRSSRREGRSSRQGTTIRRPSSRSPSPAGSICSHHSVSSLSQSSSRRASRSSFFEGEDEDDDDDLATVFSDQFRASYDIHVRNVRQEEQLLSSDGHDSDNSGGMWEDLALGNQARAVDQSINLRDVEAYSYRGNERDHPVFFNISGRQKATTTTTNNNNKTKKQRFVAGTHRHSTESQHTRSLLLLPLVIVLVTLIFSVKDKPNDGGHLPLPPTSPTESNSNGDDMIAESESGTADETETEETTIIEASGPLVASLASPKVGPVDDDLGVNRTAAVESPPNAEKSEEVLESVPSPQPATKSPEEELGINGTKSEGVSESVPSPQPATNAPAEELGINETTSVIPETEEPATEPEPDLNTQSPTSSSNTLAEQDAVANPTDLPTSVPKSPQAQREQSLTSLLVKHSNKIDTKAPHALKAIQWMTQYDSHALFSNEDQSSMEQSSGDKIQEESLLQRYCLSAVFFATHPEVEVEHAADNAMEEDENNNNKDDEDNQRLRHMLLTSPPDTKSAWMTTTHICDWRGIECDTDEEDEDDPSSTDSPRSPFAHQPILLLDLSKSELKGNLPREFALLLEHETSLLQLDLSNNLLTGSLPTLGLAYELDDPESELEFVYLQNNQFTGSVPHSYMASETLYHVDLSQNQLHGTLPIKPHLTHLRRFYAYDNQLTGNLPAALFDLTNLSDLRLHNNQLEGKISTRIGQLSKLGVLTLANNKFTGSIPNAWEGMAKMAQLDLQENPFQGKIPDSIPKLPMLQSIVLGSCQLTGTIPEHWVATSKLQYLVLSNNKLTGSIPPSIGQLIFLKNLGLNGNTLHGSIPSEIQQCVGLEKAFLNDNQLEGPFPSDVIVKLHHLESLELNNNHITGSISSEVCGMKHLYNLRFLAVDCKSFIHCSCCDNCYRKP